MGCELETYKKVCEFNSNFSDDLSALYLTASGSVEGSRMAKDYLNGKCLYLGGLASRDEVISMTHGNIEQLLGENSPMPADTRERARAIWDDAFGKLEPGLFDTALSNCVKSRTE